MPIPARNQKTPEKKETKKIGNQNEMLVYATSANHFEKCVDANGKPHPVVPTDSKFTNEPLHSQRVGIDNINNL